MSLNTLTTIDDCLKVAQAAHLASQAYATAGELGMARRYADHCATAFHMARVIARVPHFDDAPQTTTPEPQA